MGRGSQQPPPALSYHFALDLQHAFCCHHQAHPYCGPGIHEHRLLWLQELLRAVPECGEEALMAWMGTSSSAAALADSAMQAPDSKHIKMSSEHSCRRRIGECSGAWEVPVYDFVDMMSAQIKKLSLSGQRCTWDSINRKLNRQPDFPVSMTNKHLSGCKQGAASCKLKPHCNRGAQLEPLGCKLVLPPNKRNATLDL